MDSFELNKIIGAILLVALLIIGIGKVSNPDFNIISTCESGKVSRTARKNPVDIIRSPSQFGVRISIFEGI